MSKKTLDLLQTGLPKWPGLLVSGKPVTRAQAKEILVRTDSFNFFTNDRLWQNKVQREFGIIADDRGADRKEYWLQVAAAQKRIAHLSLGYLANQRIYSSWIGGPHGWCDWNGVIFANNYNIGKWPSAGDVFEDWKSIAAAFPFLSLRSQLLDREIGEDDNRPLIEFVVDGGAVTLTTPVSSIPYCAYEDKPINDDRRERGCSLATLRAAVKLVKERTA